ncbi:hypothetical protein HNQ56_004817 [Anaerotaenia torta]|uniref:DUF5696 domain-containing protein n=1 Tax=Anaerotaenia torta TaxID=433293 RepID=UPI003D1A30A3
MIKKEFRKFTCIVLIFLLLPFAPLQELRADTKDGLPPSEVMGGDGSDMEADIDFMAIQAEQEDYLARMQKITQNDALELYLDEKDTNAAVRVKATGDIWFTNPPKAGEDAGASAFYQRQMKAQFSIRYFNENVQASEMDNYNDSILGGQFEITPLDNGVTITYTLGELVSKLILPEVISEERMLMFTSRMEEKAAKKVLRYYTLLSPAAMKQSEKDEYIKTYPGLELHNIYIQKAGTKDYVKEEMMEYFVQAGYTAQDKENDIAENGAAGGKAKPWFKIPLTYTLEKDNLLVSIDPGAIEYNSEDGFYLVDIDMMEYFGAADTKEKGYIFVPDGSGALINLNNGKVNVPAYSALVYGEDRTLNFMRKWKSEVDEKLTVKMPVFGLKAGDKAWLGIIEEGDGYADISAQVSGVTSSYNNVYPGFTYLQYGSISLDEVIGSNSFQMYSNPDFKGTYKIRYGFLHGEEADYSGMAAYYRNYLVHQGKLKKLSVKEDAALYVELIGAIEKYQSFLGIKYLAAETLTTYSQAKEITDILKQQDIDHIIVKYAGWAQGGLKGGAVTGIKPLSKLNRQGVSMKEYLQDMTEQNIPVYMDVDFQYVHKDTLFDGYNRLRYAPRYFDNTVVKAREYFISNGSIGDMEIQMISPYFAETVIGKFVSRTRKYSFPGISLGNMSHHLYSDLYQSRYTDRQTAISYYEAALQTLEDTCQYGLLGDNSNVYTLGYMNGMLNAPMDSNHYRITDEVVPFYEMVIRGYMSFAGAPLNNSDDYKTTLLKSVESGADLYVQWIYEDNSRLVGTDYDEFYSVNYKDWVERIVAAYHHVNEVYRGLEGQIITEHEKLQSGVYKTTYEKGREIVVNYNKEPVTVDGVTVPAQDFTIVKGW